MKLTLNLAALLFLLGVVACDRGLPRPSSQRYAETVTAFYRGVAAAQVGETALAAAAFERVTQLAPREPAGWANRGLIALQRREPERAAEWIEAARALAPEDGRVLLVAALVERERGRGEVAAEHLRRAVATDARNLPALYLLATHVEQEGGAQGLEEARELIERMLAAAPGNFVVLLDRARLAVKLREADLLGEALDRLRARTDSLAISVSPELQALRAAARREDFTRAATDLAFLQTRLQEFAPYQDDERAVRIAPGWGSALLAQFVELPTPTMRSSPADTALAFAAESLTVGGSPVAWVRAVWLGDDPTPALVAAGRDTVWVSTERERVVALRFPGDATAMASLDYDYDFRVDFAVVGSGGVRLFRQDDDGFTDVTGEALPSPVVRGAYAGVWAADLDMEGDLDLVLAPLEGAPVVLRNRGDGRFERTALFGGVAQLRGFAWADLDADGDPDAIVLDASGRVQVVENRRTHVPQFQAHPLPDTLGTVRAIAVADANQDGELDLILLRGDGALVRVATDGGAWVSDGLGRWPGESPANGTAWRLHVADLDNNGDLDLVATSQAAAAVWLGTAAGLVSIATIDAAVTTIADLNGDGRLDLIGVTRQGRPQSLANRGTADYYSTTIRPRAAQATGDRRINPFGIGGEIEVRAGLLYQKQVIVDPAVHFGLGDHPHADVARIIWPNGTVQAEFNLSAVSPTILTRQRLKGSCPWVFAFDGEQMQFVTDFLWRSALGLRINDQGAAAVIHSEDWIKIRGDQLVARGGFYDVRITAELWESHFFDHVSLMVVDHPEDTEVFVDERFTLPAPPLRVHATRPPRPIAGAWDHRGRDVTALVRERDGSYLGAFEFGSYQGVAREHYVEVALGDDVPAAGSLWLVASGWVYPTDASINVAYSQADRDRPRGLQLEVPDGRGGWTVVDSSLGFPSGKSKTILIDLRDVFRPDTPRHVRLRTNLEVYWDQFSWAVDATDAAVQTQRLLPTIAELRYRGYSAVEQNHRRDPEVPRYHDIASTVPQWRDLIGYHTRFGDVRGLNEAVDDRYTIMNAGDELALRFAAPPPPPPGWARDFVLIGDGWVKDGDYNTGYSTTVLPLPYHALSDYARPPTRLEDDPAYRLHPDDWRVFHTRYVTPRNFYRALVPQRDR